VQGASRLAESTLGAGEKLARTDVPSGVTNQLLASNRTLEGPLLVGGPSRSRASYHPPIGALGFAPQKTWLPSIPIRCTSTMFRIIDFAVA
jgi:hypothetical protein